jgi:hypothetical protein
MEEVIGLRGTPGHGSLAEWGVSYRQLDLCPEGGIDWEALATAIKPGGCADEQLSLVCSCSPALMGVKACLLVMLPSWCASSSSHWASITCWGRW